MKKTNLENPILLYISLILIVSINIISSIHFSLIMFLGILFNAFYVCLKKRYLYSLLFVIFTFLFVEVNSGFKPFSLVLLAFFIYIFIIPRIENIISFSAIDNYIYILLFYIGMIVIWILSFSYSVDMFYILGMNILIDIIFFGLFL